MEKVTIDNLDPYRKVRLIRLKSNIHQEYYDKDLYIVPSYSVYAHDRPDFVRFYPADWTEFNPSKCPGASIIDNIYDEGESSWLYYVESDYDIEKICNQLDKYGKSL